MASSNHENGSYLFSQFSQFSQFWFSAILGFNSGPAVSSPLFIGFIKQPFISSLFLDSLPIKHTMENQTSVDKRFLKVYWKTSTEKWILYSQLRILGLLIFNFDSCQSSGFVAFGSYIVLLFSQWYTSYHMNYKWYFQPLLLGEVCKWQDMGFIYSFPPSNNKINLLSSLFNVAVYILQLRGRFKLGGDVIWMHSDQFFFVPTA